jgi:ketosteroid isomerase-like protein
MYPFVQRCTLAICVFLVTVVSAGAKDRDVCLSPTDLQAIRNQLEAYRTGWLSNDAQAVQRTFTQDAVLLPPHGLDPVVGMEAIKQFWWPEDAPHTTISRFELTDEETGGCGSFAFIRGRSRVEWTVEDHGKLEKFANAGTFLTLLRKLPDQTWKISHQMWDDPPNQRQ